MKALGALLLAAAGAAGAVEPPKLSFGGQVRARYESASLQGYASPGVRRQQDLYLLRTRLNVAVDMPEQKLQAFLQPQDSRTAGTEASVASNEKNLDMHQAYLDIKELFAIPLDMRAGRFEMNYGDGRMISSLDWSNTARAWDGARLKYSAGEAWADAFVTKVKDATSTRASHHFWGLYASCQKISGYELDAYLLGRDNADQSYANEHGTAGNLADRYLGARAKGTHGRFAWTGEAAWQFGRRAGQRVRAWGSAATARYSFDARWNPFAGLEHTFGSGDASPGDNQVQTFDPPYTFGHFYYGYQDLYNWKNGHDFVLRAGLEPAKGWLAMLEGHRFLLHHSRDAWYDATGASVARDASGRAGKDLGTEVDFSFRAPLRERIALWFGYSRFWAASYARRTAVARDRDWGFFQAALNF